MQMKLLGNTRELEIITESCHEMEENYEYSGIKYPLYEANYINGIRMIFQQAINIQRGKKEKKDELFLEEISNILSFVGARGSGKTTVMNEFCNILSDMNNKRRMGWWLNHALNEDDRNVLFNKEFYFHILKPIDASLLAESEDLFELILANLYRKFEEKMQYQTYGYKDNPFVRKVLNDFSEIEKLYHSVIAHETNNYEDTFISRLQRMKGSEQIKEKIAELIENLLAIQEVADYEYIVVSIDDLDLNLRHGYEMLEQLQKYFSYYKIIVLVTLDYEQMQLVCEEYFEKSMLNTSQRYLNKEHSRVLANDYMIKVFPLSQRMYMPEMRRISKKSKIKLQDVVFEEIPKEQGEKELEVKNFVLLKIAEVMQIYYDARGLKMHFSEPETVRNLVSYNKFLESLEEIDYENLKVHEDLNGKREEDYNDELLKKYDKNHERFNTDINVRMVQSSLNGEQKEAFDMLKKRDLERRARYFVCSEREEHRIVFHNIIGTSYAYGDLLGKINKWGKENAKIDYFLDKPFICCILASFTCEMICQYIKYRHNPDKESREKYKTRLVEFLGKSFSSQWIGEAFPQVIGITLTDLLQLNKTKDKNEEMENGFIVEGQSIIRGKNNETTEKQRKKMEYYLYGDDIPQGKINFNISIYILKKFKNEHITETNQVKDAIKEWLHTTQLIQILECVDMFFVRREGKNKFQGITYEFVIGNSYVSMGVIDESEDFVNAEKVGDASLLTITGKGGAVTLDIMGFVIKSISYREVAESLYHNIVNGLTEFLCHYLSINDKEMQTTIEDIIKEEFLEKSIFKDYMMNEKDERKWKFKEDIAFPYYNLDMSYNIFKRVKEHYKNEKVMERNVFAELVKFYEYIGKLLKAEEDEYKGPKNLKYVQTYQDCPYIKNLDKWNQEDSNIPYIVQDILHKSVSNLIEQDEKVSETEN